MANKDLVELITKINDKYGLRVSSKGNKQALVESVEGAVNMAMMLVGDDDVNDDGRLNEYERDSDSDNDNDSDNDCDTDGDDGEEQFMYRIGCIADWLGQKLGLSGDQFAFTTFIDTRIIICLVLFIKFK